MKGKLDASLEQGANGAWRIRVPLRREEVRVAKQTYVVEEVEIRREYEEGPEDEAPTQRISSPVRPPR
ncbi:MAG TPA: DUF2382 domain-containing protein [Chloroflexota bacterium]|jgi:stress response protein YsnF|nr:DUF2382 domain-containing protein [Chloroflexota bacterium]